MKRITILKVHRKVGVVFAPFFILSSLTGIALLFRKNELYSKEVKNLLIGLHNWEYGAKYIGIVLAVALITMSITGLVLAFKKKW